MRRLFLLLLAAASIHPLAAAAAQPLTGRIEGPAGEGLAYATVVLVHRGVQAAGTTTDSLGTFRLQAAPGAYELQARHLACSPLKQDITVETGKENLGIFRMAGTEIAVKEVVVTGTSVTREADRFVMTIANAPAFAGKDGAELLAEAPGVWIDDKGVSINGMKGVKIFVDERELRLDGDKLTVYLRSLTAADVARIEVIPQAGVEYSADARGGVVRITLCRQARNGMNGSLTAATTQGAYLTNYAPSGNLSLRTGRWTVNAAGSGLFTTRGEYRFRESRQYPTDATRFSSTSDHNGRSNFGSGRLGLFHDISPRHTIGAEAEYTAESGRIPSTAETYITQQGTETTAASRYRQHTDETRLSAAVNYIWKIDTVGSAFKLLADYTRQRNDGDNDYRTRFTAGEFSHDTLYRSTTASKYTIFSAEAGLDKRFSHGLKLLIGVKYTRNRLRDDARYEGRLAGEWIPQQAYSYEQGWTEQIAAAYGSLSAGIGRWNLSAGLRGEYTATDSRRSGVHKSYVSLFPSASASYALNRSRTWIIAAQYSRNIQRPGFAALNPARLQLSDYNYQVGNPALRPTYIHRTSLTVIWKYRYTLTVGANLHRDLIREVCMTDPANPDITFIMPENHYTENHWFAALNAPVQLMRNWTLTVNAVGVKQDIRLTRESPLAAHWLLFTAITSGINLPAGFYFELSYNGQSRLYSGNSEVAPRHTLSAALKKRLCRDRLTFSVAVKNLNGASECYLSRTDGLVSTMQGRTAWGSRYCKVSLTWNFRSGTDFKARRIEGAADAERQRLKKSERQ